MVEIGKMPAQPHYLVGGITLRCDTKAKNKKRAPVVTTLQSTCLTDNPHRSPLWTSNLFSSFTLIIGKNSPHRPMTQKWRSITTTWSKTQTVRGTTCRRTKSTPRFANRRISRRATSSNKKSGNKLTHTLVWTIHGSNRSRNRLKISQMWER